MGWSVEHCHQDSDIFEAMRASIRDAKVSVDFETFIFEKDSLGNSLLREFVLAAKRGLRVRLLLDGVGSPLFNETLVEELVDQGVEVRIYRPWRSFFKAIFHALIRLRWKTFVKEMINMNRRNHRKTCVVDRRGAWVGSANVSMRHQSWRETFAYVEGDDVDFIASSFDWIWNRVEFPTNHFPRNSALVRNSYGFQTQRKNRSFRRSQIADARRIVRLVNPYFFPPFPFLLELLRSALNGIRVEIMVPSAPDWKFVVWITRTYYAILLSGGAKIYEYQGMIHSKILITDDQAIIGSSNFNFRSFLHDMEIDILLSKPETIDALNLQWEKDLRNCKCVDFPEVTGPAHWYEELRLKFFAYLKRVL